MSVFRIPSIAAICSSITPKGVIDRLVESLRRCYLHPVKKKQWIILNVAILVLAFVGFFPPPVDGYYRSPLVAILDGSTGYLQLHDGTVDILNTGGTAADSRTHFGTYRAVGRSEIEIVFAALQHAPERVSVGWMGFHFSSGIAQGMPDGSRCGRELLPWRLHRLNDIK